jgi:hypothetical protein
LIRVAAAGVAGLILGAQTTSAVGGFGVHGLIISLTQSLPSLTAIL